MKSRLKTFIFTYFYFTRQEKKGIIFLLFLVMVLKCFSWYFSSKISLQLAPIPSIPFAILQDSLEKGIKPKDTLAGEEKSMFSGKANKFFSVRTEENDSLIKRKKTQRNYPIELNSCDSEALVSLMHIGPYLAHKILVYRKQLGGFNSLQQLTEIYGFKEDYLFDLEGKCVVDTRLVRKIDVNTANLDEMKTHPYFKYTLSKAIIAYRQHHGLYKEPADLRGIKLVTDSIYQMILPYCIIK